MSETILHITSREAWETARKQGRYTAPSLANEGFIHCSTYAQVLAVAEKFYKGQAGLILLVIDSTRLASNLKWESPFDGAFRPKVSTPDRFPHIYGPINLDAVVQVLDFVPASDGSFVLPSLS
ncbi:MAG TPA: DUF952 domain-containing protein [Anaerolineales bacterium]|nr:DUF952 domain-containing protein [Anaerolineales bacterium]